MERYAIGMQDFGNIRRGGYVYVDKTQYIPLLLEGSKYYFLARPRRFGKSLFLSTLEYFFLGERDLFKGLSIDSYEWDWTEYPVIHIDLNGADYTQSTSLDERLSANLGSYEIQEEKKETNPLAIQERFRNLITSLYDKTGKQVVVLVDEYEKPILDTLDYPELSDKHKELLRGFYGVLKSLDKYLKFVFLTGVTKFGQMNVFSGLNNIRDISLLEDYGAICGITEKEMIDNFPKGIEDLAKEEEIEFEEAVHLLKENYDGYHFSKKCPDIYNPYSLINAFADREINAYWSATGTPSLLAKILKKKNFDLEKLDKARADRERLMGMNNQFEDPVALFYQTGYLTIKTYDKYSKNYILGYPNKEVEKAFFKYLLPNYSGQNIMETSSFMDQFKEALERGNPRLAMEVFEDFSAGISYDVIPLAETERHFQYIVYIVTKLLSSRTTTVKVEDKTSDGRIDLLITTPEYIYVVEIKKDETPEEALKQIRNKEYALQYRNDTRKVFLIGMNFSTEKKRLDGFIIESL